MAKMIGKLKELYQSFNEKENERTDTILTYSDFTQNSKRIWCIICHICKYTKIAVIVQQHCCSSLNFIASLGFELEPTVHNIFTIYLLCTGDLFCQI